MFNQCVLGRCVQYVWLSQEERAQRTGHATVAALMPRQRKQSLNLFNQCVLGRCVEYVLLSPEDVSKGQTMRQLKR